MNFKNTCAQILKTTVETTQKTLESINVTKVAETVDTAKKKFETKLEAYKNKLDAEIKAHTTENNTSTNNDTSTSEAVGKSVEDLALSASIKKALIANGITTVNQLRALTDEDLLAFKGIGTKAVEDIRKALTV